MLVNVEVCTVASDLLEIRFFVGHWSECFRDENFVVCDLLGQRFWLLGDTCLLLDASLFHPIDARNHRNLFLSSQYLVVLNTRVKVEHPPGVFDDDNSIVEISRAFSWYDH